jgi:HrpA-like RNA helicase
LDAKGKLDNKKIQRWVKPSRRIIVATNIAETGVTIETLKYCIDTGFVFSVTFNPDFGAKLLVGKNITKGMGTQRKGRVGRKSPGEWYPCYTERVFNNLAENQFAKILDSDITSHLMNIITTETESQIINVSESLVDHTTIENAFITNYLSDSDKYLLKHIKPLNFSSIDFFETPSSSTLVYSLEKLYGLGFIDSQYNPTLIGYYSKGFNKLSMESIRMIFAGFAHGANVLDLITITAFLMVEMRNVFGKKYKPFNTLSPKVSDDDYEFYYKTIIGDQFIECLLVWETYSEFLNTMMSDIRKKASKGASYKFSTSVALKWCEDHKIEYNGMIRVSKFRSDIIATMIGLGLNPYYNGLGLEKGVYNFLDIIRKNLEEGISEVKKIKKCIFDGYRFNLLVWDDTMKRYIHNHKNTHVQVIRNNLLSRMGDDAVQRNANFIIAAEIIISESQKKTGVFEFYASAPISIMDALDIDLKFILH